MDFLSEKATLELRKLGFWVGVFLVWQKDTRYFLRHPFHLLGAILFSLILAVVYSYSIEREVFFRQFNFDGIMLSTLFFANTLLASQSFYAEGEGQVLRILHISALDAGSIYTGKLIAYWQSQLLFILICIPVYFLLLQGRLLAWEKDYDLYLPLLICLSICALSLAALGTLLAAAAQGSRLQALLLPLLLLPSTIPVLLLGSQFLSKVRFLGSLNELSLSYYLSLLAPALLYVALGNILYFHLVDSNDSQ